MSKFSSSAMYIVIMAVMALSCAKETADAEDNSAAKEGTRITCRLADGKDKTVLDEDGTSLLWNPGDEINVFYGSAAVKFKSLNTEPSGSSIFASDKLIVFAGLEGSSSSDKYIWAAYPYEGSSSDGKSVTVTVKDEQTAAEDTFSSGTFPSVGRAKSTDIAFYNVCGGIKFSLCQSGIGKIVISGNNEENLAGKVRVEFDQDGVPSVTSILESKRMITLSAPGNDEFQTGKWYYATILPTTLAKGFNVEFIKSADENECGTRNVEKSLTVKRSRFGQIENLDKNVVFSSSPSFTEWKKKVIVKADAMLHCPWTPIYDVDAAGSKSVFKAGVTVEPIPYGGTGETENFYTFVGLNVSFYTFLSIVNNPKSHYYNSSMRLLFNRPFYGTVCSAFVPYCWGMPSAFFTKDAYAERVPYFERFDIDSVDELKVAESACWYHSSIGGHILIVTDIVRDRNGKMLQISTTEANNGRVHAETYTKDEFQDFLDEKSENLKKLGAEEGVKYFRYDWKNYSKYLGQPGFCEQERVSGYTFPDALCPDRGDKVSYPYGTAVNINILSDQYASIELYKSGVLYKTTELDGTNDVTYENLPVGMYRARLVSADGNTRSSHIYFQVGATSFTATQSGDKLILKYNDSNAEIQFISLNTTNGTGNVFRYVTRVKNGEYEFTGSLEGATHVRVHFAGKYSTYRGVSKKIQ